MKNHPREFCEWFVQILPWYLGQPSEVGLLEGSAERMFLVGRKRG